MPKLKQKLASKRIQTTKLSKLYTIKCDQTGFTTKKIYIYLLPKTNVLIINSVLKIADLTSTPKCLVFHWNGRWFDLHQPISFYLNGVIIIFGWNLTDHKIVDCVQLRMHKSWNDYCSFQETFIAEKNANKLKFTIWPQFMAHKDFSPIFIVRWS